jgi:rhomboid protease GluP
MRQAGQWWRLVTAGFLHGGLLHIAMNSWVLFDLGPQVNRVFGTRRFLVIYFVATVVGFYASTYWSPAVSVGASAGICGLIGAMIAAGMRVRNAMGSMVRAHYTQWAIYILVLGFLPGLRIDTAAHIGGLAGGFVVAYLANLPSGYETSAEKLWRLASVACVLVTAACFGLMFLNLTVNSSLFVVK